MNIDIDYVVPMVFPQDLKWRHDYITANGMLRDNRSTVSSPRFRSWGTEELLVRCIMKNLPWVRTIHIILARTSQVQEWMEELKVKNEKIKIVFHADIMPKEVLPTFNSRAIEMYLHRIPGLAPYFLYGNDDMFPIGEMGVEEFFRPAGETAGTAATAVEEAAGTAAGEPAGEAAGTIATAVEEAAGTAATVLPCLHYTKKTFNPKRAFQVACMNGLNFVAGEFGQRFDDHWLRVGHNVVPMVKATCDMFWERWPKKMQASVTPFRTVQNYNQYIYSWWQILSGEYVDHRPPPRYLPADASVDDIREAIRTADGLLCINDNSSINDITNLAAIVRSEIERRL